MAATLWTGTSTAQNISNAVNGVSFQPDLVWTKCRNVAYYHTWMDSVRGISKGIYSNSAIAEETDATYYTAINANGFTVGTSNSTNNNSYAFVGWQWKAGGTAVSNTAGSITSSVSANTTAGFSVVTYTGTGANATVGHGLGVAPSMVIVKSRSVVENWPVYHASMNASPATGRLILDGTAAFTSSPTTWNNTAPTSTVFSIGTASAPNTNASTNVAYCFAPVAGYSAFDSYTGNGSADGPFVYLGFRPRWIMIKASSFAGESWYLFDTTRSTSNVIGQVLVANQTTVEFSFVTLDVLSNGFKIRTTNSLCNTSGATYIYAACAENPFKYANAR
jgi:hypothetical protein